MFTILFFITAYVYRTVTLSTLERDTSWQTSYMMASQDTYNQLFLQTSNLKGDRVSSCVYSRQTNVIRTPLMLTYNQLVYVLFHLPLCLLFCMCKEVVVKSIYNKTYSWIPVELSLFYRWNQLRERLNKSAYIAIEQWPHYNENNYTCMSRDTLVQARCYQSLPESIFYQDTHTHFFLVKI